MPRETVTTGSHVGLISSLPKWAQKEIHRLDRALETAVELREQARRDSGLIENGTIITIPRGERFVHRTEEALRGIRDWGRIEAYFHPDGSLDITCPGLGIEPMSGNRVVIRREVFK